MAPALLLLAVTGIHIPEWVAITCLVMAVIIIAMAIALIVMILTD